jgi:hypothetical protein
MHRVVTVFAVAGAMTLIASETAAAPGGGSGGGSGGAPSSPSIRDPAALPREGESPAFRVGGKVVDRGGAALDGVVVKMFANGMLVGTTETDRDGSFEVEGNPQSGANDTTTLWFESPDEGLLPTGVILGLGSVAAERHLFSACTPRLRFLGDLARIDVTMLTLAQRNEELSRANCVGK